MLQVDATIPDSSMVLFIITHVIKHFMSNKFLKNHNCYYKLLLLQTTMKTNLKKLII